MDPAAVPLDIAGVDPGCAMLDLAAHAGVPSDAVYLGAGLLRRLARTEAWLGASISVIETPSGFLRGRADAEDLTLTNVMLLYAACVCLANKAYGRMVTSAQRLCLRGWAHELTTHPAPVALLADMELGCLVALGWRL
jgi:hypothetical protein